MSHEDSAVGTPGNPSTLPLDGVTGPVLVAHHKGDNCSVTLPSGAKRLAAGLTGSSDVGLDHLGGGFAPRSSPFNAKSEHGFYGIEDEVDSRIATFIRAHTDP